MSIVDNRNFKRLCYQVLDHTASRDDVRVFFRQFHEMLGQRGLVVRGITTDASALYPLPIREVFGELPHQICTFHILAELTEAVLLTVAQERKRLATLKPKLPWGRPRKALARLARKHRRLHAKVRALFDGRFLFVRRQLTSSERQTLLDITRGLPRLRVLREIMEEIYELFHRQCRTEIALAKLAKLRRRLGRFQRLDPILNKLDSTNLEKALTYLDDSQLPSTSNAVERSNRRYRKMQKSVYRVRTQEHIRDRIALDMIRDQQKLPRTEALGSLHQARAA